MRNFVQTDIPGDQYFRANAITLNNERNAERTASFHIESVTNLVTGGEVLHPHTVLTIPAPSTAEEATETVTLYDLEGNNLGSIPRGEMYQKIMVFLNSEMIHEAVKADHQEALEYMEQIQMEAEMEAERIAWEAEHLQLLEQETAEHEAELARLAEEKAALITEEDGEV